jgi:hypothetical protein
MKPIKALASIGALLGLLGLSPRLLAATDMGKAPDATQAWADLQTKSALNGVVQASVSYSGKDAQVMVFSKKRYTHTAEQTQALQAARLIQRDVALFCGSHCQALPMPSPELQADGRLRFVLRLTGLGRQLFQEELQALLSGSTGLPEARPQPNPSSPSSPSSPSGAPPKAKNPINI